mgnify:CR=1 FL=1
MTIRPRGLLPAAILTTLAAAGVAGAVAQPQVTVGSGFPGAGIGATPAQVVRSFGTPTARDDVQLTYDRGRRAFVAFVLASGRVREVRVNAGTFCTTNGICMGAPNGVRRLRAAYGSARGQVYADDGSRRLGVIRTVGGRRTSTNFVVSSLAPSGRVTAIEIVRCPGLGCGPPTRPR